MKKVGAVSRRERREVRELVNTLLTDIDIPAPFDVGEFCAMLSQRRDRHIQLTPMSRLLGEQVPPFSGLWVAGPEIDYIFYDDATPELHWENSILHELGHMAFAHRAGSGLDDSRIAILQALLPNLSTDLLKTLIRRAHGRDGYTKQQEVEAELFAAGVWQRAGRRLLAHRPHREGPDGPVLDRLSVVLYPQPNGDQ